MCYTTAPTGEEIREAFAVLEAAKNEPGRTRSGRIAHVKRAAGNRALASLLKLTHDPLYQFELPDLEKHALGTGDTITNAEENWKAFHGLAAELATRKIGGPKALITVREFLNRCSRHEAHWYRRVLERNLQNGLATLMTNHVWPNLIPRLAFAVPLPLREMPGNFDGLAIEPVSDGTRIAFILTREPWTNNPVVSCYTENGRPIEILAEPIGSQLLRVATSGVFEGELSIAGMSNRQAQFFLSSHVKSMSKQSWRQIYYSLRVRLFDYCSLNILDGNKGFSDPTPFTERRQRLVELHQAIRANHPKTSIRLAPSITATNGQQDRLAALEPFLNDKSVEAIRFRKLDAGYFAGSSGTLWTWKFREVHADNIQNRTQDQERANSLQ